ncbi:MAG: hypothetical protein NT150_03640 [Bacteroidetes bacterium]|nr:hypothetical protein [Bacteroidota bacterium]
MSKRNINIDEYFKDALSDFKVEAPLREKQKRSFLKSTSFKWIALSVVVVIAAVVFALGNLMKSEDEEVHEVLPVAQPASTIIKEVSNDSVAPASTDDHKMSTPINEVKPDNKKETNVAPVVVPSKNGQMIITEKKVYYETYEEDDNGNQGKLLESGYKIEKDTTYVKKK